MNWNEAQKLMTTARNPDKGKPIGNNTRLYFKYLYFDEAGIGCKAYYSIRLHGNEIMQIFKDRIIPSDSGWQTVTTKARLNENLPRGFYVFQKDWEWFLQDMNTNADEPLVYPFNDVRWIHNDKGVMLYSTHPRYPQEESPITGRDIINMILPTEEVE